MPGENHERRISTVEANMSDLLRSNQRIENYMEKLFNQQGDLKTTCALVVQNQDEMKVYRKECDDDRDDHEKRITAVEGFQSRLVKMAIAVTGVGSLISPQLSKIWERFFT